MTSKPDFSSAKLPDVDIEEFFEMTYRLSHLARHRLQAHLASYNLTPPQYSTMRAIENHDNSISVSALAEAGHQVSPTITGILNRLEERGLVIRRRSPSDRRNQMVSVTRQGEDVLEAINHDIIRSMKAFLAELTPEEREILLKTTRSLTDRLAEFTPNNKREDDALE